MPSAGRTWPTRIGDLALPGIADRTTLLSADLLRLAAAGEACLEALAVLRPSIDSPACPDRRRRCAADGAIDRLLSVGHTSGADLATGLAIGLMAGPGSDREAAADGGRAGGTMTGSAQHVSVRRGVYHDSVTLLRVSQAAADTPGITAAQVAMATPLNTELAAGLGFSVPDGAGPERPADRPARRDDAAARRRAGRAGDRAVRAGRARRRPVPSGAGAAAHRAGGRRGASRRVTGAAVGARFGGARARRWTPSTPAGT